MRLISCVKGLFNYRQRQCRSRLTAAFTLTAAAFPPIEKETTHSHVTGENVFLPMLFC